MITSVNSESELSRGFFAEVDFHWILSVGASLASITLSLSSIPTIQTIVAEGTTGRRPLLPFSAQTLGGFIWFLYGLLISNMELIVTGFFAFITGAVYFVRYLSHVPLGANWLPGTHMHHRVVVGCSVLGALALFTFATVDLAVDSLGKAGSTINIVMFASPLSTMPTVIQTRSTSSMALSFAIGTTASCMLWFSLGCVLSDPYIWGPNAIGLVCAACQLSLFAIFGNGPNKTESQ